MRKPLRALVLTTTIAGSAAVGVTSRADAQPVAVAVASAESACPYRYVVSDGKRNNVAVYASARARRVRARSDPTNGSWCSSGASKERPTTSAAGSSPIVAGSRSLART